MPGKSIVDETVLLLMLIFTNLPVVSGETYDGRPLHKTYKVPLSFTNELGTSPTAKFFVTVLLLASIIDNEFPWPQPPL